MKNTQTKNKSGLLAFSTKSYPTFGRQKKEFEDANPPNSVLESPYYWWYMFAKLSEDYKKTCKANGRGKHAKLYKDFGDIHNTNFKVWLSPKSVDKYDVKTEMENLKCKGRNTQPSSRRRQLSR